MAVFGIPIRPGTRQITVLAIACCALLLGACGDDDSGNASQSTTTGSVNAGSTLPQGSDPVKLDPADFTTKIDNPYWPISKGKRWVYTNPDERIVVTRTSRKKTVAGIKAVVLTDTVTSPDNNDYVEVTEGLVRPGHRRQRLVPRRGHKEYENGKVASTEGSWEHGVDGALCRHHHPRRPQTRARIPAGVLQGRGGGRRQGAEPRRHRKVPFGDFETA